MRCTNYSLQSGSKRSSSASWTDVICFARGSHSRFKASFYISVWATNHNCGWRAPDSTSVDRAPKKKKNAVSLYYTFVSTCAARCLGSSTPIICMPRPDKRLAVSRQIHEMKTDHTPVTKTSKHQDHSPVTNDAMTTSTRW